jgi:hypothetical protein
MTIGSAVVSTDRPADRTEGFRILSGPHFRMACSEPNSCEDSTPTAQVSSLNFSTSVVAPETMIVSPGSITVSAVA